MASFIKPLINMSIISDLIFYIFEGLKNGPLEKIYFVVVILYDLDYKLII